MTFKIKVDRRTHPAADFIISAVEELQKTFVLSGLTSQELAGKLERDHSEVEALINGKRYLTLRDLGEFAWAMGVEPDFRLRRT